MIEKLSNEEFGRICLELVYRMGFNVKSSVQRGRIIAVNATYKLPAEELNYIIIFIKKNRVTRRDIADIVDLSLLQIKYLIITTGEYDDDAIKYAKRHDIVIVDRNGFEKMLKDYDLLEKLQKSKEYLREERKLPSSETFNQYLQWAKDFYEEENYQKALEYAEKALKMKDSYEATIIKVKALRGMGRFSEAAALLKDLIIKNETAEAWHLLGMCYEDMKEFDEALKSYNKAVEIDPQYYHAWASKGLLLHSMGKVEEALLCYNRALKINKKLPHVWNNKGVALKELKRLDEAITCYDIAHELDKNYLEPLYNKAVLYFENKRYEEAIKVLQEYTAKRPEDARGFALLALCYDALEDYLTAKGFMEKALELSPKNRSYKNFLKELDKKIEKIEKKEAEKVSDFEVAFAKYILGEKFVVEDGSEMAKWIYAAHLYENKKYDKALEIFQDLQAEGFDVRFNIASCKSALKRNIEAMSLFLEIRDYARGFLASKKIGKGDDVKKMVDRAVAKYMG